MEFITKLKKSLVLMSIAVFLVAGTVAVIAYQLRSYADRPAAPDSSAEMLVTIRTGQSLKATADILLSRGIITSPTKFIIIARIKRDDKRLKAGEYLLSPAMSPANILEIMVRGAVKLHKLTVPEGYTFYQIAALVEKAGLGTRLDFIEAATDPALAAKNGLTAKTFEGYLFPDTYFFPKDITVEKIIGVMLNRFRSVFTPEWKTRSAHLGLTVHQVVTLASIIEKETGAPSERSLISSVFHNRLKKGMRLESDPTVIYGIKNFDGNLTRKHLVTRTPYNTYKIKGLPPGPIANPGRAALSAALYPEDTAFIYFVAKKDHTHHFSTNFKDHNRAVRKYQLRRR